MRLFGSLVFWLGTVMLITALLSCVRVALAGRRKSDAILLLLLLLLPQILRSDSVSLRDALGAAAFALVPYALLRLARHFRDIPSRIVIVALVVAAASFGARLAEYPQRAVGLTLFAFLTFVAMSFVAMVFGTEVRRTSGIRSTRLALACIATLSLASVRLLGILGTWIEQTRLPTVWMSSTLAGTAFIGYYLAFAPPRWLFSRWQRSAQAADLDANLKLEPEERGRRAPDDLFSAAQRAIGGALTLVVDSVTASIPETIRSSDPELRLPVSAEGLLARSLREARPVMVDIRADGGQVDALLSHYGETLLVAPIVSDGRAWGIVAVVHRRGALFPEDDLVMLDQLARTAAVALDHAALIAERRERERSEADRRMREMETRVTLMLESIKDYAMLVLDGSGQVATWQPGAQHLFGYSAREVTGQSATLLFQTSAELFQQWLDEARAAGYAERECTCRRLDGSTFVGVTIIRPLVNDVPGLDGFVAVTHDVTTRRAFEDRARQGQKMEAIGRLAGGVAHDFNNLLMVILGHADWLDRGLKGDPRREEVAGIQQAAERAADLTRRLLAFSRRNVLQPSRLNLSVLVSDMLPMLRRLITDTIEVVDATTPGVPEVMGDHTQLQQVLLNLVVNARDAMPDGGTLTVRTADVWLDSGVPGTNAARHVLLEVSDTGIGMDAQTRQLAFEPFFTTKDVGKGTGLGLSTVYGIIQQLGGRIHLESEPGKGTTFRIYLPEVHATETSTVQTASLESLIGPDTLM